MQVSCWEFSGYESALGIWFVVEKINWWFSQQGCLWHQWTCWLNSGYFCVISEFLGILTVGLEIRLPRVEASAPTGSDVWVALRLQVHMWGDVLHPVLHRLCGGCSAATSQTTWAMAALALSVHAAAMPLFVLQTGPTILPCCWSCCSAPVGAGREWGRGSLLQHQAPPAAYRVMGLVRLWSQPLVLLPTCFSQNGLVWPRRGRHLLVGLSLKEGSCSRGSERCGGCWGWQLAGTSVCTLWQASYAAWVHNGACSSSPAGSFRGTSWGLRSSSEVVCCGGGSWSLGPQLCALGPGVVDVSSVAVKPGA